jgi:diadenosine tetraphosphate (Ap4A) HIT family hydrolase
VEGDRGGDGDQGGVGGEARGAERAGDRIADASRASRAATGTVMPCPFCTLAPDRILLGNGLAIALRDAFPISPGHTLIVPRRHVGSFFEATVDERAALLELLDNAKRGLDAEFAPDSYNIGINDGPAAGQTVSHLHIHLIPRYSGDCADPRGGVRWIVPDKADYWSAQKRDGA